MDHRLPCNYPAHWNDISIGDCSQHLKTGECPVINGFISTFGGGSYVSPPVAILSGYDGPGTGFFGFGQLNDAGYVVGLDIVSSGWHFTSSPMIVFSGAFRSGVRGSDHNYDCSGRPWNDPKCLCSGSGSILGFPVYTNVTEVPPQCSDLYTNINWINLVNNQLLPPCDDATLALAATDNYGRCKMPAGSGHCVASWQDGWSNGDCGYSTFQKAQNINTCQDKGSFAPFGKCVGTWYEGDTFATNGPDIIQRWQKTDQYLDFGVCKKRGYKNVVALKSWHGEPPFTVKLACDPNCTVSGNSYNVKYLSAVGTWNLNLNYTLTRGIPAITTVGYANGILQMSSVVDRKSGKTTANQAYSYNATNWGDSNEVGELVGLNRGCIEDLFGYHGQHGYDPEGENGTWNYCTGWVADNGHSWGSECIITNSSIGDTTYTFTQEITRREHVEGCHIVDDNNNCVSWVVLHDYTFRSLESVTVQLGTPYDYATLNRDAGNLLDSWNLMDDLVYPWKTSEADFLMPKVTYCESPPASPLEGLSAIIENICSEGRVVCRYTYSDLGGTIHWDDCTNRPDWPSITGLVGENNPSLSISCSSNFSNRCVQNCIQDGRVLGVPALPGHFGTIDFARDNQEELCCTCECDTFNNLRTKSFGATSPLHHATQWPTEREKKLMYFGAFASINDASDISDTCSLTEDTLIPWIPYDTLVVTKHAEIIQMDKPSLNFRLPCGIGSSEDLNLINNLDQLTLSKASPAFKAGCVAQCDCGHPVGSPEHCEVCSGEGHFVPRWSYESGRSFACGDTLDILSGNAVTTGLHVVFSTPHSGSVGDYVNAYVVLSDTTVASGVYVIGGVDSTTGIYLSGVFASTTNNVSGWIDFPDTNFWFDNSPKGEFVVRHWNYPNFIGTPPSSVNVDPWLLAPGASFDATQYCLSWQACDPSIVVITNQNSIESRDQRGRNVQIIEMPQLVPQRCGSRMHYIPQQWMADPLWLAPSEPCCLLSGMDQSVCAVPDPDDIDILPSDVIHTWEEDDGSCQYDITETLFGEDSISFIKHHYFPMRPWIEARQGYPAGDPYTIPTSGCAFPNSNMPMVKACYTLAELEAMPASIYQFLGAYYNGVLCALCLPPHVNQSYWTNQYAPWLVGARQQDCLNEAYPPHLDPVTGI